ncbi:MAG: glutathione S-transferase family protein [Sphingomonadales bacterium]
MLELYHWEPNVFSLAALTALNEKGLDYASRYLDWLNFEQLGPDMPALNLEAEHNPEYEGPLLKDGDALISESFFLMEYLDDKYPETPLKLRTPYGDWQVQVWGRFLGERVSNAVSTLGCHRYLHPLLKERRINSAEAVTGRFAVQERQVAWREAIEDSYSEDVLRDSKRKAGLLVERIEKALAGGGEWLVENSYTIADIDAFSKANSLPKLLPDVANEEKARNFWAWLERMRARPAVRKALATSKTGKPDEAFAPGPEHPRWG